MRSPFQKHVCAARTVFIIPFAAFLFIATAPNASAGPILGPDLSTFAILGGAGVAVNGTGSVITGSVGGCCTVDTITGYPAAFSISGGTVQQGGATATAANAQLGIAITALNGMSSGSTTTESELGGLTLGPGVYVSASTMHLAGTLTLDGFGNANALWVFLLGSALSTDSASNIIVQNTGAGAGVYWVLGSSVTPNLGSGSTFQGNILAHASIAVSTTVTVPCGRLLTQVESVTLAGTDTIGGPCSGELAGSNGLSGGGTLVNGVITPLPASFVPEPNAFFGLAACLAGLAIQHRRSRSKLAKSRA
jgi:hypothetical protein